MENIENNLKYIKKVKPEEIEWTKLFGAYNCGRKIGEDIKNDNLLDLEVLENIENEIEHQSTLWTITPFVMIFLTRQLEKDYGKKEEEFYYLLEIYKLITETLKFTKAGTLDEKFYDGLEIYPEMKEIFNIDLDLKDFDNDEEDYTEAYYEEIEDIKYNSSFYYTDLIVQNSRDTIEKLLLNSDEKIKNLATEILKNL